MTYGADHIRPSQERIRQGARTRGARCNHADDSRIIQGCATRGVASENELEMLGRNPANWIGAHVGHVDPNVTYAGKRVAGLRLRVLGPATVLPVVPAGPSAPPPYDGTGIEDMSDSTSMGSNIAAFGVDHWRDAATGAPDDLARRRAGQSLDFGQGDGNRPDRSNHGGDLPWL